MLDLFKHSPDVKSIRSKLLQFIKQELQKTEGGEGQNIQTIFLYIDCKKEEKHLYEAAVHIHDPGKFRTEEIQRFADDYAINLPPDWELEIKFEGELPVDCVKTKEINAGIILSARKKAEFREITAVLKVLKGETELPLYNLSSATGGKTTIGREKEVQTSEGFYRQNTVAFPSSSSNESNRSVSRQHAHIEWSAEGGSFYLFADEGGVPPMNKIKVRRSDGQLVKLLTTEYGHSLKDGDQIILGESALLQFIENKNG